MLAYTNPNTAPAHIARTVTGTKKVGNIANKTIYTIGAICLLLFIININSGILVILYTLIKIAMAMTKIANIIIRINCLFLKFPLYIFVNIYNIFHNSLNLFPYFEPKSILLYLNLQF